MILELHTATGDEVLINTQEIERIVQHRGESVILTDNPELFFVRETPHQIREMMQPTPSQEAEEEE